MTAFDKTKREPGRIGDMTTMGVAKLRADEVQITLWRPGTDRCELCIYDRSQKQTFPMYPAEEEGMADFFTLRLKEEGIAEKLQGLSYDFAAEGKHFADPYAREIVGRSSFGRKQGKVRGRFDFAEFDWSEENWDKLAADDMILYQCHVRGFTRHKSSGVEHPGTFLGLQEKIPYLRELGVNTLLLLPVYDFDERMKREDGTELARINYWGYTGDAFYFAPKAGYSSGENATEEFQQMVKSLHQNGMNILLDMYFEDRTPAYIVSCLRYYALRFHIDGFRINQECMDTSWLKQDPVLSHVKLLGHSWGEQQEKIGQEILMELNDRFLIDARRFLKSDEGQAENFYRRFREQGNGVALVHCITQHNGFTLRDLVSYDVKHNEDNGEKNQDGTEYNYSWNCGVEGPSRKREVLRRRACQERNAFVMLMLGMATPMLLAGDEFGNTQKGNNNAYCQDNAVTWLDWQLLEKNAATFSFVKKLIAFRKAHPLYHQRRRLTGMDLRGLGAPDVSCHGKEPWETRFSYYSREVGVLYYGGYYSGPSLYLAFNFHWDRHEFFLPSVETGGEWKVLLDTSEEETRTVKEGRYEMAPRSIALFESTAGERSGAVQKKKKKRDAR